MGQYEQRDQHGWLGDLPAPDRLPDGHHPDDRRPNVIPWPTLTISFLTDFILTAGGTISGSMLGAKEVTMPALPIWILATILGVMAGARRVQALLAPPPPKP